MEVLSPKTIMAGLGKPQFQNHYQFFIITACRWRGSNVCSSLPVATNSILYLDKALVATAVDISAMAPPRSVQDGVKNGGHDCVHDGCNLI